jgi:hypothetical protein
MQVKGYDSLAVNLRTEVPVSVESSCVALPGGPEDIGKPTLTLCCSRNKQ